MRALLGLTLTFGMFYLAFVLGQVNMKRKYKDRRDPLPIIRAARNLLIAEDMTGVTSTSFEVAVGELKIAMDGWDPDRYGSP